MESQERRGQMTREEALAHAEREGLTLVRSATNKTGFKNLQYYKGDPPQAVITKAEPTGEKHKNRRPNGPEACEDLR